MKQNNEMEKEFSAIILAAGKSERLGFPKISLKYDENTTFVEHIVKEYKLFGCKEIILVVNEISNKYLVDNEIIFHNNVKIVINEHPDWHRFYSLKIGAKSLSETRQSFVHNVDNPFVNHSVLRQLAKSVNAADYLNPEYSKRGGHPILISERIIKDVKTVQENQLHFKEFLSTYPNLKVQVDDKNILVNINTEEEYIKYFVV
ncbi:NTP transferase domain-containing protein [Bacteroidota bacterium]